MCDCNMAVWASPVVFRLKTYTLLERAEKKCMIPLRQPESFQTPVDNRASCSHNARVKNVLFKLQRHKPGLKSFIECARRGGTPKGSSLHPVVTRILTRLERAWVKVIDRIPAEWARVKPAGDIADETEENEGPADLRNFGGIVIDQIPAEWARVKPVGDIADEIEENEGPAVIDQIPGERARVKPAGDIADGIEENGGPAMDRLNGGLALHGRWRTKFPPIWNGYR
ncbi:hypothetical protein BDR06DRAFT_1000005 [Suillus hirtellus]|nr:hypothetical protein BDR06DRAFT_1000005 [Suillus hirtellus]